MLVFGADFVLIGSGAGPAPTSFEVLLRVAATLRLRPPVLLRSSGCAMASVTSPTPMSSWRASLTRLFEGHRGQLERMVRRRVRDGEAAADIVQDVFARVFKAGSAGSDDDDRRILYAAARNAAIDHNLAAGRRARALARLTPEQLATESAAQDDALAAQETLKALERALERLNPRTRDIFVARRLRGETNVEIAKRLGITVRAVEKQLARGLEQCREALAAHLGDDFS